MTTRPDNIFQAQFTTGQVVKASGITNAALQTWIRRGAILGQGGEGVQMPGKPGIWRAFSFFSLMEISVAAALIKLGLEVSQAFAASRGFAHFANGGRVPGVPFNGSCRTILAVAEGRSAVLAWRPGQDDDLYALARHELLRPVTMALLDINDLFDQVVANLGLHPSAVLDAAYRSHLDDTEATL